MVYRRFDNDPEVAGRSSPSNLQSPSSRRPVHTLSPVTPSSHSKKRAGEGGATTSKGAGGDAGGGLSRSSGGGGGQPSHSSKKALPEFLNDSVEPRELFSAILGDAQSLMQPMSTLKEGRQPVDKKPHPNKLDDPFGLFTPPADDFIDNSIV